MNDSFFTLQELLSCKVKKAPRECDKAHSLLHEQREKIGKKRMDREALEKRKKIVYEFICDDLYVPMKAKEIAMILQDPKSSGKSCMRFWMLCWKKVR